MGDYARLLRKVSMFNGLGDEELQNLEELLRVRECPKETVIVNQEETGNSLYIIMRGQVKVVLYGESGREITLSRFREGDFFGEMSLLDNQPRSANVIAIEDTSVLVLDRDPFVRYLTRFPRTSVNILAEMCARLRRADEIIGNLALLDVYGRVARALRDLAEKDGERIDGGVLVRGRPTQQELASQVGTSRETVSRAINEFARRGYLVVEGRNITFQNEFLLGDPVGR
jgi:CRP-like cAMP-binding protein